MQSRLSYDRDAFIDEMNTRSMQGSKKEYIIPINKDKPKFAERTTIVVNSFRSQFGAKSKPNNLYHIKGMSTSNPSLNKRLLQNRQQ